VEANAAVQGMVAGALFGASFPFFAILIAAPGFDVSAAHASQSILYIVDTAPLVLGGIGWMLGRVYGRLRATRNAIEETVQRRTEALATALNDLQHAQAQLLNSQKLEAIGGLAAGVAHEINTPIQFIGDNARFLSEAFDDLAAFHQAALELGEAVKECGGCPDVTDAFYAAMEEADLEFLREELPIAATQTLEGVGRVAEIVRALKDFSHPGEEVKSPLDLNKSIESTLTICRNEWKYVAEVETDLDPDLPMVSALGGPVNQALLIVIVNAAQALAEKLPDGEKGLITIATRVDGNAVVVSIEDDAGGIPEHIQDRIFEPFFTTKEVGKGSGQGLAIARAVMVEQHDGELSFEVRPGVGTTFFLRFPTDVSAD
jgi:signal transduction histidine kinase